MKFKNFSLETENKFSETKLSEMGFILGACEDGTFYYRSKKNQYTIEIEQKVLEWLKTVHESFKIAYDKNPNIRITSSGFFRLIVYSKDIYNEILEVRKDYKRILNRPQCYQIGFIRGLFDAEGTVHNKRYAIRVSSNQRLVMEVTKKILENLQIKTGKIHADKTAYILPLYGKENLRRFSEIISFRHPEKKARLNKLIPA